MPSLFPLVVIAIVMLFFGVWHLMTPLDALWQHRERVLLSRGLAPQRSAQWEQSARLGGWAAVAVGLLLLAIAAAASPRSSSERRMSGVRINGREMTQEEWDACKDDDIGVACAYAEEQRLKARGEKAPDSWEID